MTNGNPSGTGSERRQFFRAAGVVYLHIQRGPTFKEDCPDSSAGSEAPAAPPSSPASPASEEGLDPIALKLAGFRSRLHYDLPQGHEYLLEIAAIVEQLHHSLVEGDNLLGHLPKSHRKSVIISGSGLEFITADRYRTGEPIKITLTFPDYPSATVVLSAEVVRVAPYGNTSDRRLIGIAYKDISEADQDLIIKYVNHLQRKKLAGG